MMKEGIERSLAVVQLGITLVGLTAGATGGASAGDDISPVLQGWGLSPSMASAAAIALVVVPLTFITIVIGELVPSSLRCVTKSGFACDYRQPCELFLRRVAAGMGLRDLGFHADGLCGTLHAAALGRQFQNGSRRATGIARDRQSGAHVASNWSPRREHYPWGSAPIEPSTARDHAASRTH